MKTVLSIIFSLFLFPLALAAQSGDRLTTIAEQFVDRLAEGKFDQAGERFDAEMKKRATPEMLKNLWSTLGKQVGAYQRRIGSRVDAGGELPTVFVTTKFASMDLDMKVVINHEEQIVGFYIAPAASREAYAPPEYVDTTLFDEREVKVGSGPLALNGTLTMPNGNGPFTAVVLVHGSGPNDRDETVGPNKPFRDIAWGLASKGVAVLRYEKRTRQHPESFSASFTVREEVVDDALAAVDLLRATERIDSNAVYLLGHSLGGMMAPRIGEHSMTLVGDSRGQQGNINYSLGSTVAGLIILAGTPRQLPDLVWEQVNYLANLDGSVSAEDRNSLDAIKAQMKGLERMKTSDTSTAPSLLGLPARYWLDLRSYDAGKSAARLKIPILVMQGERDYQVTMKDFAAWKKALASKKNVTFRSYPALNHLFIAGTGKGSPEEYQQPGHVERQVVEDIVTWVRGK